MQQNYQWTREIHAFPIYSLSLSDEMIKIKMDIFLYNCHYDGIEIAVTSFGFERHRVYSYNIKALMIARLRPGIEYCSNQQHQNFAGSLRSLKIELLVFFNLIIFI